MSFLLQIINHITEKLMYVTRLFEAIKASNKITIDGYEIDNIVRRDPDTITMFLENYSGTMIAFKDQDIEVNDGNAIVRGTFDNKDEVREVNFCFITVIYAPLEKHIIDTHIERTRIELNEMNLFKTN